MGFLKTESIVNAAEMVSRRQQIPFDEAAGDLEYRSIEVKTVLPVLLIPIDDAAGCLSGNAGDRFTPHIIKAMIRVAAVADTAMVRERAEATVVTEAIIGSKEKTDSIALAT